jgi:predicted ester cyclase
MTQETETQKDCSTMLGITLQGKGDISECLAPGQERTQSLTGFEPCYLDIVDYIIRCTHRIWEENGVGLIYNHYKHNIPIWTTEGVTYGRDAVIAATLQTQAAFPDLRLYGDEVIWTGDDQEGFHTSHRITWVGHNTGYSKYGPPTGRKIVRRGIANCLVKRNLIVKEWIARDEMGLVLQLGLDPHKLAREMARREVASHLDRELLGTIERVAGQGTPEELPPRREEGFDVENFVRRSYHEIWNWRLLNKIDDTYVTNALCHTAANRELYGRAALKGFILSLLAAFPDAALDIDHLYWIGNERYGYRVAVRWTLQGTHEGPGVYGEPTGKRIRVLGISHHEIKDGRVVEEWMMFDEFALLKQLYAPLSPGGEG